jgi:hypothetical protein
MNDKIKSQLRKWREERNIKLPLGADQNFERAIEEEVDEYTTAVRLNDTHGKIDAIVDIMVFCENELALEGYDSTLCLKQVMKHLNCREQDAEQKADWEKNGPSGKWKKSLKQDPETLYQPDYSVCKLAKS